MNTISERKLNKIINDLKIMRVENTIFDVDEGGYCHMERDREVMGDNYYLVFKYQVTTNYTVIDQTFDNPQEYIYNYTDYHINIKLVMYNEEEFSLSPKQQRRLEKEIINNLDVI